MTVTSAGSASLASAAAAGKAWSPLAQKTSGSATGETLTLTLPQNTRPGNTVVLALSGYHGGAITGIILGATSGKFTKIATSGGVNAEFWSWPGISETTETITVTASADGIIAYAYEVSGYAGLSNAVTADKTAGGTGTGTSWSSGATGTTLNATELVIGLGYMTGGGTITGPGSGGWHNETAITGVAGATTSSAISGWQVTGTSGAAYTYAGSAGTSAAWGAAAVTFLLMPANSIWAGYQFNEHAAYTGISATFTVPDLTAGGGAYNSIWVGMGGPDGGVLQCGIYMTYDHGQPGNATCRPWSWWLAGPGGAGGSGGGAGETWEQTAWPVAAGDSLTCAIEVTSDYMNMTITNSTQDWTYTEAKSVLALNIGFNAWNWPMTAAEVVIENEGADGTTGTMPGFGTVTFTDITTTPAINGPPQPMVCVNTYIDDYPEPFSLSGGAGEFTMAYVNYT